MGVHSQFGILCRSLSVYKSGCLSVFPLSRSLSRALSRSCSRLLYCCMHTGAMEAVVCSVLSSLHMELWDNVLNIIFLSVWPSVRVHIFYTCICQCSRTVQVCGMCHLLYLRAYLHSHTQIYMHASTHIYRHTRRKTDIYTRIDTHIPACFVANLCCRETISYVSPTLSAYSRETMRWAAVSRDGQELDQFQSVFKACISTARTIDKSQEAGLHESQTHDPFRRNSKIYSRSHCPTVLPLQVRGDRCLWGI